MNPRYTLAEAHELARLEFDDPDGDEHVGYAWLLRAVGAPLP